MAQGKFCLHSISGDVSLWRRCFFRERGLQEPKFPEIDNKKTNIFAAGKDLYCIVQICTVEHEEHVPIISNVSVGIL